MSESDVTVVRVYLTEAGGGLAELMRYLHDESKVKGVTVFRGISGFGRSGRVHSSTLLDMSLDLPLVVEFFDEPAKVRGIVRELSRIHAPGHVVWWPARVNDGEAESG